METPPKLKSEGLTSEEMLSDGIMMLMKPSIEHLDDKVHRVRWVVDIHIHFSCFSSGSHKDGRPASTTLLPFLLS